MRDPKEIAAGILARGKAQGGGVLCVGCHIGYMSPTCPTHGPMKEAHDKASREYTEKAIAHQSVTELCAAHGNLGEYIAQLERQRDTALSRLAQSDALLREALPVVDQFAYENPTWGNGETTQDPFGATALRGKIHDHLATATTKEGK